MWTEILLIATAFVTATLSGVLGMGGGITLLIVMAQFFPPAVLIPIHGIVQLGSNLSRTWLNREHLDRKVVAAFAAGGVLGAAAGSRLVVTLPEESYRIVLAVFILVLTWMPKFESVPKIKAKFFLLGGFATFVSLFIGATGPLLAPFFLRERFSKEQVIATKAGCQIVVHTFKVGTFLALGFIVGPYLPLLAGMLFAVFAGTYCGKLLLGRLSEIWFRWLFKGLITVLAVRMLVLA